MRYGSPVPKRLPINNRVHCQCPGAWDSLHSSYNQDSHVEIFSSPMRTKRIVPSILAAVFFLTFSGVSFADVDREKKPRFKGVELYSWKSDEEKWLFVILDGTNRLKSTDEVKKAKNQLKGMGALKNAFGKLAENEQVFWLHRIEGFEYPPKALRKQILSSAKEAKISLNVPR